MERTVLQLRVDAIPRAGGAPPGSLSLIFRTMDWNVEFMERRRNEEPWSFSQAISSPFSFPFSLFFFFFTHRTSFKVHDAARCTILRVVHELCNIRVNNEIPRFRLMWRAANRRNADTRQPARFCGRTRSATFEKKEREKRTRCKTTPALPARRMFYVLFVACSLFWKKGQVFPTDSVKRSTSCR